MNRIRLSRAAMVIALSAMSTSVLAGVEPSQSFATALQLAENQALAQGNLGSDARIYQVDYISIGKYAKNSFGDYTIRFSAFSANTSRSFKCESHVNIKRVPFAKQQPGTIILEEVTNNYQIIARLTPVHCVKTP